MNTRSFAVRARLAAVAAVLVVGPASIAVATALTFAAPVPAPVAVPVVVAPVAALP